MRAHPSPPLTAHHPSRLGLGALDHLLRLALHRVQQLGALVGLQPVQRQTMTMRRCQTTTARWKMCMPSTRKYTENRWGSAVRCHPPRLRQLLICLRAIKPDELEVKTIAERMHGATPWRLHVSDIDISVLNFILNPLLRIFIFGNCPLLHITKLLPDPCDISM